MLRTHCLQARCATSISHPIKEIDVLINALRFILLEFSSLSFIKVLHQFLGVHHVSCHVYPNDIYGWKVLPTPGALIHIRITWALSPTAPQVTGVTLGSSLYPWCFGLSLWRGVRHSPPINIVDALINYTRSRHTNAQVAIIYGAALY
jgi:hypothetical protein